MQKIIVVGYPKSGCTWATRLVAELVGCPVAGFWASDKKEIAVEGETRISDFRVYKSHHQLAELLLSPNELATRVLYILRDPRDIALSAASHFQFDRFPAMANFFRALPRGEKFYRHSFYPLFVRQNYRLARMTEALLHGSAAVHNWVRVSWRAHWQPFLAAAVPIFRYEDLLAAPEKECRRLLDHLGLARSDADISVAIENQSFARKKQTLLAAGETGRAKFLRSGQSGRWKQILPPELQVRFRENLGAELARWGYEV